MAYIYIAHAPQDQTFVKKLSQDLVVANLDCWYAKSPADESIILNELKKSTHLLAVLSSSVELHEPFLAALEFAKQNQLERLAIRIEVMEQLPPQLRGVLPLDFTDPNRYADALETLLEDFRIAPTAPVPQLPPDIMEALHSEDSEIRQDAILKLRDYRADEDEIKQLALDELHALAFRERNSTLKALVRTAIQLFEQEDRAEEPEVHLPSKSELELQSAGRSIVIDTAPHPVIPPPPPPVLPPKKRYLWQSKRWYALLGGAAILLALIVIAASGQVAAGVSLLVLGAVLPAFNIWIRKGGQFEWKMPGPVVGNAIVGLVLVGIVGGLSVVLADLEAGVLAIAGVVGLAYALLVGWLSAIEV